MSIRLVLSAHADDEIIGAGGTLAKIISKGSQVHIGVISRDTLKSDHICRKSEAEEAWKAVGITNWYWGDASAHPLSCDSFTVGLVAGLIVAFVF